MLLKYLGAAILLSTFCFAGTCPAELSAKAKVQELLEDIDVPRDWTYVAVCNEMEWKLLLQHFGETRTGALGATSLSHRTTWFKGDIFKVLVGDKGYKHVVFHEIGHIRCQCMDEGAAESIGLELMKRNDRKLARSGVTTSRLRTQFLH